MPVFKVCLRVQTSMVSVLSLSKYEPCVPRVRPHPFPTAFEEILSKVGSERPWFTRAGGEWVFDYRTPPKFFDLLLDKINAIAEQEQP